MYFHTVLHKFKQPKSTGETVKLSEKDFVCLFVFEIYMLESFQLRFRLWIVRFSSKSNFLSVILIAKLFCVCLVTFDLIQALYSEVNSLYNSLKSFCSVILS